jgi:Secretion system C-terminal sorting domain
MSQYSKFIRPGFVRVGATSSPQTGVYLTAYKKGSQIVVVVVNNSSSSVAQTFTIPGGTASYFTPYVTSTTKNFNKESNIVTSGNSFNATLDASSVTTFVSDGNPDLPVELTSFNANIVGDKVNISWATATEKNNAGFEIQRSVDNKQFVSIGFVKGNGTTTERQSYSFTDNNTGNKLYYRLKQVDFDGSFTYSNVLEVSAVPQNFELLQNYPNPFNPVTQIKYSVPENAYISLKVYNLLGEEVATLFEGYKQPGNYEVTFNGSGLASGIYLYRLKANEINLTKKFVLLK